jgi:hypothetical protein
MTSILSPVMLVSRGPRDDGVFIIAIAAGGAQEVAVGNEVASVLAEDVNVYRTSAAVAEEPLSIAKWRRSSHGIDEMSELGEMGVGGVAGSGSEDQVVLEGDYL